MRRWLILSVLGLLLGVFPASAQDVAAIAKPAVRHKAPLLPRERPAQADAASAAQTNKTPPAGPQLTSVPNATESDTALAGTPFLDREFGWTVVTDPATAIRIGLPAKMVPIAHDAPNGTRWSSRHGDIQVETFRIKTTDTINALFDQYKREPSNRRVEYSLMKPDNFFISGLQGLKKFSVRAQLRDGELRGFTMLYDQAMEGIVAPVMVAMTTAYAPFPDRTTPFAALSKPVEYGTGLIVSAAGHIVTDRKLAENCQVIVAAGLGSAERVDADASSGLALLRIYGKDNLPAAQLADDAAKSTDMTLIGVPDPNTQGGARNVAEVKARVSDNAAIELRQSVPLAGFSGAAALDNQGHILGLMQTRNAVFASVDPAATPMRLISAATIRDFLAAHHIIAAHQSSDPKASVVRIICVRK